MEAIYTIGDYDDRGQALLVDIECPNCHEYLDEPYDECPYCYTPLTYNDAYIEVILDYDNWRDNYERYPD